MIRITRQLQRCGPQQKKTYNELYIIFFSAHFYFPASSGQAVVTGVVPSPPLLLPSILSRIGFSNPTARRFFIECVASSRSRAFRTSICAQEKVPTNLSQYVLGGIRSHETDLLPGSMINNLIRHPGDRLKCTFTWCLVFA